MPMLTVILNVKAPYAIGVFSTTARIFSARHMQGRTTSSCISKSLNGGICTTLGPTKNDMVTLQATAPVSLEGKVIGAVLVGMSLTKNDAFADRMKKIFGTEVTIFSGNERVSSTLMDNGRRAVGTKLDNDLILDEVIKKKNIYSAVVSLFNKPHMAIYWPLRDVSENVIGMDCPTVQNLQ